MNADPLDGDVVRKLGEGEFERALAMTPRLRYAYSVNWVRKQGMLWVLGSDEGYCLALGETGEPGLPIWPHPDFAQEQATGDWADGYVESIALQDWLRASELPEPAAHVAVFFTHVRGDPCSSVQVSAAKLAADLRGPASKAYEVPVPRRGAV